MVLQATRVAGRLNGREIVPPLVEDRRYSAASNVKTPRRIESVLELYDCINCDLCISACPNDAIFAYEVEPTAAATEILSRGQDARLARAAGEGFAISSAHQLAVVEGACNECSNCEVYCPEDGAPFRVKEQLFVARESFESSTSDGFFRAGDTLYARLGGESPGVVHIDGTARPQLVDADSAPDFHAILTAYHRRTGVPSLINTSFNLHEEPIVCTPADALRAFQQGHLDYLAIGNWLVAQLAVSPRHSQSQRAREWTP